MDTRIAFATSTDFPQLTDDDRLAARVLANHGIHVEAAIWTAPDINWSKFSAVVIRSCWDYHHKQGDFRNWLSKLEQGGVTLWNPYQIIRWNMDKVYLNDLQERGIPVLDLVWLEKNGKADLHALMQEKGWSRVVVKPMVSAAAHNTESIHLENASDYQWEFETLLSIGGVIVQDFAQEINSAGEWSLIFFNKEYSHSVIKRPQDGDFRVQFDFGGKVDAAKAPDYLISQAQKIVNAVPGDLLYARVDGIERNRILTLMELELIEPHLFFELDSNAPQRFANALVHALAQKDRNP
jgi:glutathione synthase/RimK-type ligase-like ATP-grasp enzyme